MKITDHGLRSAIQAAGGITALAKSLNITRSAVSQWKMVPIQKAVEIEKKWNVPREVLRPDYYQRASKPAVMANRHMSKEQLRDIIRNAHQERQRIAEKQVAIDESETLAEARQQLSAEMRKRREAELQLVTAKNESQLQVMPSQEQSGREMLIAKARQYLESNGFIVIPMSALEASGFVAKATEPQPLRLVQ